MQWQSSTVFPHRIFRFVGLIVAGAAGLALTHPGPPQIRAEAPVWRDKAIVIPVVTDDLTDGRRFKNLRDLIRRAESEQAGAVVFQLNVSGEASRDIFEKLLEELTRLKRPRYSLVDPAALGAGAVLALGTDAIYMTPTSVVGGAGLKAGNEESEEAFRRNFAQAISVIKARVRSLAKANGHDPEVAEAFVDSEIEVKRGDQVISEKGEVLTLTAEEAVAAYDGRNLLAKGIVADVESLLKNEGITAEVLRITPGESDRRGAGKEKAAETREAPAKSSPAVRNGERKEEPGPLFSRRDDADYRGKILVLPVQKEDLIIPARFQFMDRVIKKAKLEGAAALIMDMNTPGGAAWETAELMTKTLAETPFPTVTFVNPNAVSAGSLIAVATDTIYMYPASNIGSALVVSGTGMELGENMQQKVDQMMISTVRNVAELKGHNPDVAEAFVNKEKEVIIDGVEISAAGTVLNLNANEATEIFNGRPLLAKGIARSIDEIVEREGFEGKILRVEPLGMEAFAQWAQRFSFLLIILGLAGAYMELNSPGFGVPGVVSLLAFGLFFFGNNLAGNLAGHELLVLLVLGLVLIAVEVFILPGTMIPGVVGGALVLTALGLAMVDRIDFQYTWEGGSGAESWANLLSSAVASLAFGVAGAIAAMLVAMRFLPESRFGHWMVLEKSVAGGASLDPGSAGDESEKPASRVGQTGEAVTDLRPAGKGRFGGKLLDITADGQFIEKSTPIRITKHEGSRIVVVRNGE